jgi:hypothetical protein
MFTSTWRKLLAVLIGILTLALLAGRGSVLAAQNQGRPLVSAAALTQPGQTWNQPERDSAHTSAAAFTQPAQTWNQPGQERKLAGLVQSIDQAKQTFRLLPSGQTTAVTIVYDAHTSMRHDQWTVQSTREMQIVVHVLTRRDGSWYATGIESVATQGKHGPAGVQSGSYPTWRGDPCGWSDQHGWGSYHK